MTLAAEPAAQPQRRAPYHWRVVIAIPPAGFGRQLAVMQAWLDASCGAAGWEAMPAGIGGARNDAIAFHFADRAFANAFLNRFCCGYKAP